MSKNGTRTNFENLLQEIRRDPENVFSRHPRMLSHLSGEKLAKLQAELSGLDTDKKAAFYNAMCDAAEESFEHDFTPIAALGIRDENGEVRAASFRAFLNEDTEEVSGLILDAAQNDPCEEAQIAAIRILGQYMYDEEMEDPIPVSSEDLHRTLEKLLEDKNPAVRRGALVAYAPSGSKRVHELISGFLAGNDKEEITSALRAIRISLNEKWNKPILELLNHEDEDLAIEAIMTAGMLQLREALPALFEILSRFDRISPEMLTAAADAVAEIGDESALDVLETLGEAVVDMDEEITDAIDDSIDTLNMSIEIGPIFDEEKPKTSKKAREMLNDAIEKAKDRCLGILEEKIPHDLEDDEPFELEEEEDECDCGEEHHHHHHHHHDHHDNPLEGLDLSRFRILDDLEAYESAAGHDADEEDLWAEFEDMDFEDLDADSLQDFIDKLAEKKKKKK